MIPGRAALVAGVLLSVAGHAAAGGAPGDAAAARPGRGRAAAGSCPEGMILVRGGGPFELGMLEGTRRRVKDFCLDRTEVTVEAYAACAARGACTKPHPTVDWSGLRDAEREEWSRACNGERADRRAHPANCLDWTQADAYCRAVGRRLPSEEEWEWAARGGARATRFPWGNAPAGDRVCWNVADGGAPGRLTGTCPVASRPAGNSPIGLADLGGNVWEWTASHNRTGHDRVTRGGGWYYNSPLTVSAIYREWHQEGYRSSSVGFRCAADPAPAPRR